MVGWVAEQPWPFDAVFGTGIVHVWELNIVDLQQPSSLILLPVDELPPLRDGDDRERRTAKMRITRRL